MPLTLTNGKLIEQLFDNQPDSVVWYVPVFEKSDYPGKIKDFKIEYCNAAACKILNSSKQEVAASTLLQTSLMDNVSRQLVFEQCSQVWQTGHAIEYTYHSPFFDKYFNVQRSKVQDGILSITRDRTELVRAEIESQEKSVLLNTIIENTPSGMILYEAMVNSRGEVYDFHPKIYNKKSYELAGFSAEEIQSKTMKELVAIRGDYGLFDQVVEVVKTGTPLFIEYHSRALNRWIAYSIVKLGNGVLLNYLDITETKKYEQQAKEKANELDAIFNASISAVYSAEVVKDKDDKIIDLRFFRVNASFCKMVRKTQEELTGALLTSLSVSSQAEFMSYVEEVISTGTPIERELYYETSHTWFEFSMVKLDVDKVSVTYNEITEEKLAIAEIERQNKLLDNILKQSPSGIAVTKAIRNEEGRMIDAICVLANDISEQFTGVPKEVSLTKTAAEVDPQILKSPLFEMAIHTLETGQPFRTAYFLNPTKRWLELAVSKLDEDHFINVFTDITQVKQIELQQQQLLEDLKRSNQNLEEFAHAASHDLKEPIRKVHFFTDRLKSKLGNRLDVDERQLLERIENATVRMQLLVDDLLEYSHVSNLTLDVEQIDLNKKIALVLADLEILVQEKDASIHVGTLPIIKGHRRQLQQLFQNLISNALKYCKQDVKPIIEITSHPVTGSEATINLPAKESTKKFHLIEVKDNGIGFNQEDAERIFLMFQRLHGKNEYNGTGVGLAIVKKVVQNHNGYIWAESKPGKGACFKILLPMD
jgi:signal transduction histidine kinase